MLDDLMIALRNFSELLLPILGAIALVVLILILIHVLKFVKNLPETMNRVNDTIDQTQGAIKKLDAPLDTIANVSKTVDVVNTSATGVASKFITYSLKNSDALFGWIKDFFSKKDNGDDLSDIEPEEKEEDFGIYE